MSEDAEYLSLAYPETMEAWKAVAEQRKDWLAESQARECRMREALEEYANPDNWGIRRNTERKDLDWWMHDNWDGPAMARAALAPSGPCSHQMASDETMPMLWRELLRVDPAILATLKSRAKAEGRAEGIRDAAARARKVALMPSNPAVAVLLAVALDLDAMAAQSEGGENAD
jgi:hypothetical protein